jgi:GTPase
VIDEEMREMAQRTRTEYSDGTIMIDIRVLSETITGIGFVHKTAVEQGRISENDPRIIGQAQVGLLLLRMFQAIVAKHADEVAANKFKNVDLNKIVELFEEEPGDDDLTGDDK